MATSLSKKKKDPHFQLPLPRPSPVNPLTDSPEIDHRSAKLIKMKCGFLNGKFIKSTQLKIVSSKLVLLSDGLSVHLENLYCGYLFQTNQIHLTHNNFQLVLTFGDKQTLATVLKGIEKWVVLNDFNRYVWVRDLSEGCFGKVKLAKDQLKAGKLVTLKYMKVPGKEEKDARRALCNEVKILRRVSQVNLLKINAVLQNEHSLVIVSEYLDGETLEQFMAKGQVDELTALEIVRSLALAIQETHHHSFVHRDLKPQNVIFKVSKKTQKRVWKLIDFGMSEDFSDRSKESLMKDRTGTVCYMAPEILNESLTGGVYDQRVDVYSLGVILFELFANKSDAYQPFQETGVLGLSPQQHERLH